VNYAVRDADRAKRSFVDFAGDPKFGSWRTFLQGKGLFNAHYIYEETAAPDQALPFDFAAFHASPTEVRLGAFNAETGQETYWSKAAGDMATLPALMRRVRASSTMPALMPMADVDGHLYVDGALGPTGGIALDAAKADGFTRFFVVLSQPRDYRKKKTPAMAYLRWYFSRYPAVVEALAARPARYNATREELFHLEKDGQALLFAPSDMPVANGTTDVRALQASFDAGSAQAEAEYPAWLEFLDR
jgi:predicted patatin/cPLA2 family phospholipase